MLEDPPAPPGNPPFGCRLAHCLSAAWAFELLAEAAGSAKTRRRATGAARTRRRTTGEARRRTAFRTPAVGGEILACPSWTGTLGRPRATLRSMPCAWRPSAALRHRWCRWRRGTVRASIRTRDRVQQSQERAQAQPPGRVRREEERTMFIGSDGDRWTCDADPGNSRVSEGM